MTVLYCSNVCSLDAFCAGGASLEHVVKMSSSKKDGVICDIE